ncbi:Transcriptional regulator NRG1 [Colletotrichum sp. SAR11_59]|nr:Transcriptional regulator NRG1 [Colletotrichum sp. SAR11_59]
MHVRDATGRQVSLLNDEPSSAPQRLSYRTANHIISQPFHPAPRSNSSSPHTPELLRSDSYDSNASSDPMSPLTPTSYDLARASAFASGQTMYDEFEKRPAYANNSRANSYEDESSATSPMPERPGKRADNMKQHLETHYKDKSRTSASAAKAAARSSLGALSASGRRSSSSSSRNVGCRSSRDQPMWDTESYGYPPGQAPLPSPGANGAWDMRGLNLPLLSRPTATRNPSSGLDALAMAVACQEGA